MASKDSWKLMGKAIETLQRNGYITSFAGLPASKNIFEFELNGSKKFVLIQCRSKDVNTFRLP